MSYHDVILDCTFDMELNPWTMNHGTLPNNNQRFILRRSCSLLVCLDQESNSYLEISTKWSEQLWVFLHSSSWDSYQGRSCKDVSEPRRHVNYISNTSRFDPVATDNTPVCYWKYDPMYLVPRKPFIKIS